MEAVYRYGSLRDCSEKSQDWRFCMRAKMYGPVTRKVCHTFTIFAHENNSHGSGKIGDDNGTQQGKGCEI